MIYRSFGKAEFRSSLLGFGCMRLPRHKSGEIDQAKTTAMIRHAIDNGINYLDSAYAYPGSEVAVGYALLDGYREKVKIATKLPVREVARKADVREKLLMELKRLQTDYVDYYLIHRIENTTWPQVRESGMIEAYEELKEEGLIRGIGFSYHTTFEGFKQVLDYRDWDMCQVQQNYLDIDREVTEKGIRYAGERGVPLVIMEPLRGGALANVPQKVKEEFAAHPEKRTPIEWAFRHLYNYPEIRCILSGMGAMEQLVENIAYFRDEKDVRPNCLSREDVALLRRAKAVLDEKMMIGCTGCSYCMPCPSGINIPRLFNIYNTGSVFEHWEGAKRMYGFAGQHGPDAASCVECGCCEAACPQQLPIIQTLKELHEHLCQTERIG